MADVPAAIGRLRHRVTIRQPVPAGTPSGQVVPAWQPVAEVWACVEPADGRKVWLAREVQADLTHHVVIRSRADVRANGPRWRLLFDGRVLAIVSARDVEERGRFLALLCKEIVSPAGGG